MTDSKLVDLLVELIAIPSVNPEIADDPAQKGEGRLAEHLAGYLEGLGFRATLDEVQPGRPNLVAIYGPDKPRKTILFESHLDTVGVRGMTCDPFKARLESGRLHGRGACDTKGPLAALLHVLREKILEELAAAGCGVIFVGAMGEETGNIGAMALAEKGYAADEAIILEPTDLKLVTAHKGTFWCSIEVHGRAAHGSNPSRGLSAIGGMRKVLDVLDRRLRADEKQWNHPVLGKPTMNIGRIQGGQAVNIVPDACRIDIDRRTIPGEDHAALLERLTDDLNRLKKKGAIASFTVSMKKDGHPFSTDERSGLIRRLRCAFKAGGHRAQLEGAAWYSDAGPLARTCREVVVFGPGSIAQAHTCDEYIEVESLAQGSSILERFLAVTRDEN